MCGFRSPWDTCFISWQMCRSSRTLHLTVSHRHNLKIDTPHNTIPHQNTTQHNTTRHNTTQHNRTQRNTAQHSTAQHSTTQHNTRQHNTTQYNTTRHKTSVPPAKGSSLGLPLPPLPSSSLSLSLSLPPSLPPPGSLSLYPSCYLSLAPASLLRTTLYSCDLYVRRLHMPRRRPAKGQAVHLGEPLLRQQPQILCTVTLVL